MNLESLYLKSPRVVQSIAITAAGIRLNRRRYDKAYLSLEKEIFSRDAWGVGEAERFRMLRLRNTLKDAQRYVPYYRSLFKELDCNYTDFQRVTDMGLLPVLEKSTVQANASQFISEQTPNLKHTTVKTSGTTGAGLVFPMSLDAEREQWAVWWRYRSRFGLDRETWYAHFYGKSIIRLSQERPPFWRVNRPGKQIFFSAYHMSEATLDYYIDALNRYKPPWIQGYPSLLALLSEHLLSGNRQLDYAPRVVTVGSESLLLQQKEKIEKAFGVACRQHYGMTEAVANISECTHGKLHVDEDFGLVEFLDNPHGSSDLICTGFANKAFVLLRYKVGDNATLLKGATCDCGLAGRIVESIDGRLEDYVITPDGRKLGRLDHIVKDFVTIKECQVVQKRVDGIEFRVVKGHGYTDLEERRLLDEARKRLGSMDIKIRYHDRLKRSNTGKLRFVVSEIKDNQQPI